MHYCNSHIAEAAVELNCKNTILIVLTFEKEEIKT